MQAVNSLMIFCFKSAISFFRQLTCEKYIILIIIADSCPSLKLFLHLLSIFLHPQLHVFPKIKGMDDRTFAFDFSVLPVLPIYESFEMVLAKKLWTNKNKILPNTDTK